MVMSVIEASCFSSRERTGPGAGRSWGVTWMASSVRLSTRTLPLRSRMSPRGACTRISRIRLSFAWLRYLSPDRTWTYQSLRNRTEKIAIARPVMIETRRASGDVRLSGSTSSRRRNISATLHGSRCRGASHSSALVHQSRAHHQSDDPEDGNREQRAEQALDEGVTDDQEADVGVDAGADLDRRDHQGTQQGKRAAEQRDRGAGGPAQRLAIAAGHVADAEQGEREGPHRLQQQAVDQQAQRETGDGPGEAAAQEPDRDDDEQCDVGARAEDVHLREADDLRDGHEGAQHREPGDDPGRQDHFLPPPVWVVRTLTKSMLRRSANGSRWTRW